MGWEYVNYAPECDAAKSYAAFAKEIIDTYSEQ